MNVLCHDIFPDIFTFSRLHGERKFGIILSLPYLSEMCFVSCIRLSNLTRKLRKGGVLLGIDV